MKAITKLLLGIGAIMPLAASMTLGAYIAYVLISFDLSQPGGASGDPFGSIEAGAFDMTDLVVLAAAFGLIVLFELLLAVVFAVHAAKEPRIAGGKKAAWILALVFLSPFAFPTYFVLYILREPPPARVADLHSAPIAS